MSEGERDIAVVAIHLSIRTRQPARAVSEAMAVPGAGLLGCRHSRPGNDRAVLLIDSETLGELDLDPGGVMENVTTRGLDPRSLDVGDRIQIGETVVLEVTGPCAPCRRMEEIRPGLEQQLEGRRGINTRVEVGGKFRLGDELRVARRAGSSEQPVGKNE